MSIFDIIIVINFYVQDFLCLEIAVNNRNYQKDGRSTRTTGIIIIQWGFINSKRISAIQWYHQDKHKALEKK